MSIIENRVSTRSFSNKELEKDTLLKIVNAGMVAPSSKNKKPWQFIVIDEKNIMKEISDFHKNWIILEKADKAIIVCADLGSDEREIHSLMACCASTQNILLKATELEVGSLWLGLYPDKERVNFIKSKLNIPSDKLPISLIALGYKNDSNIKDREMDESKIHFNMW